MLLSPLLRHARQGQRDDQATLDCSQPAAKESREAEGDIRCIRSIFSSNISFLDAGITRGESQRDRRTQHISMTVAKTRRRNLAQEAESHLRRVDPALIPVMDYFGPCTKVNWRMNEMIFHRREQSHIMPNLSSCSLSRGRSMMKMKRFARQTLRIPVALSHF